MQDLLYKVIISGFMIGSHRTKGDDCICRRCGHQRQHSSEWTGDEETVNHTFHGCSEVARLWKALLSNWAATTGEVLDHTDPRVTLLGDRGPEARATTNEVWRVVHATAISTIWQSRNLGRNTNTGAHAHPHAGRMLRTIRQKVQELASARWRLQKSCGKLQQMHIDWALTGAAQIDKKGIRVCVLCRGLTCPRSPPARRVTHSQYCDGGWDPESGNLTAGVGVAEFEEVHADAPTPATSAADTPAVPRARPDPLAQTTYCMEQSGADLRDATKVRGARLTGTYVATVVSYEDDQEGCPGYIGATKHTNNTAELTALHQAIVTASKRPEPRGSEDIWTDSLYARNMTMGVWRPKKAKTPKSF